MIDTPSEYSPQVLEETPARVTRFLHGIGAVAIVRAQLADAGMTAEDLLEGRNLLIACLALPESLPTATDSDDAKASRAAAAEIDAWDEPNFARYGAALRRRFPEVHAYVFRDLEASNGPEAIRGVATFLARIEALASGSDPARRGTKQSDAKAVALLESRGLDAGERKRLDKLVKLALGPTETIDVPPTEATDDRRAHRLAALKGWYDEWATTARAVIKKRMYLIRLGLAQRKPSQKGAQEVVGRGEAPDPAGAV
jgi:hypothetical protein